MHKDVSLVRRYVEREWSRIYTGDVLVKDFIFAKEVRLGTYKCCRSPPSWRRIRSSRIPGRRRCMGSASSTSVIDAEGSRLMDKALTPSELLANPSRYR